MHSISSHTTAILVFARSSKEEIAHKSIFNGGQLFDALTEHTLETAAKTQLPYFHFSEEQQIGNTFGERFTKAMEAVFEKGYQQIITIGNDTPQLTSAHILTAVRQLSINKSVLGPSADGGFYLMGVHKSQFDSSAFKQLAWQTSDLSKQLLELANHGNIEVFQLQTLYDIDSEDDIKSIVAYSYTRQVPKKLLRALLDTLRLQKGLYSITSANLQSGRFGVQHNKGSPEYTVCNYNLL